MTHAGANSEAKLDAKQETALAALLAQPTVTDAAKAAKVSQSTLWRYMRDPVFAKRYTEARADVTKHLIMRLQSDSTKAAKMLIEIAEDTTAPASARVAAARAIVDGALKAAMVHDLTARIEAIEALQPEAKR